MPGMVPLQDSAGGHKCWINPVHITRVEATGEASCSIYFAGDGGQYYHVPISAEVLIQKLNADR